MKLKFKLTAEDVLRFNQFYLKRSSGFIRKYLPYLIFTGFVIYVVYKSWNNFTMAVAGIILITALLFLMLILANRFILRWHIKKIIQKNPSLTGDREIEIVGGQFIYRFHGKENTYPVDQLSRIVREKAVYLIDDNAMAIIVPGHAFKSEAERKEFLDLLNPSM